MATNFPASLDNFTNPTSTDALNSVTVPHATQHADLNDSVEALQAKVGVNSSAVTTSHDYKISQLESNSVLRTIVDAKGDLIVGTADNTVARLAVGGSNNQLLQVDSSQSSGMRWSNLITSPILLSAEERWNLHALAYSGTVLIDALTSTSWFSNVGGSVGNWTFNFRGDGSTTLNSILAVSDSITITVAVQQNATPYRPTGFQIDGSSVTPLWQGGTAPAAGNASSTDVYSFTIVKTAATPTYVVFASQTQFK